MGREIKRVPLDFDWPIDVVYLGRLMSPCSEADRLAEKVTPKIEGCDICRKYASYMGIKIKEDIKCPEFPFTEPPKGEAYQLWSTTTEGHPMTPPFATPEELAKHCVDKGVSSFGYDTSTYEQWLTFINGPGWAPSMIICNGVIDSGVNAAEEKGSATKH